MNPNSLKLLPLETLLVLAQELANKKDGGHLTLLRFTTHWKCALGTPCLDGSEGREEVWNLPAFPTLQEALIDLLLERRGFGAKSSQA